MSITSMATDLRLHGFDWKSTDDTGEYWYSSLHGVSCYIVLARKPYRIFWSGTIDSYNEKRHYSYLAPEISDYYRGQ